METITTMKSPFVPTISSADIQMPNAMTLVIPKEQMPTMPITTIGTATTTTNKITTTKTAKTIKTTSNAATIVQHALSSKEKKTTNNKIRSFQ
jgi:hypothetical protein